jgi:preprotein translocase subunit SecG
MKRTSWELPEIFAGCLLLSVAALVAGGLASGIAGAVSDSNAVPSEGAAQILTQATSWGEMFAAFMVLVALLAIWWQVETWSDANDSVDDATEESPEQDEGTDEAVRHLLRGCGMAGWAGILTGVTAVAEIVYFVSYQIEQDSADAYPLVWQLRLSTVGELVETLVLCTVGIFGAMWIRRRCSELLPIEF